MRTHSPRNVLIIVAGVGLLPAGCQPAPRSAPAGSVAFDAPASNPGTPTSCPALSGRAFEQGPIVPTSVHFNMAVNGPGYFPVRDGGAIRYTRRGNFLPDGDGRLVGAGGVVLQGARFVDSRWVPAGDLTVSRRVRPRPTQMVKLEVNLSSRDGAAPPWNPETPAATSTFDTSITVYDSRGAWHVVRLYFRNTGSGGLWEWHAMVDGIELAGGAAGVPTAIAEGALTFDDRGLLQSMTVYSSSADFVGAEPRQLIDFDFGSTLEHGGLGADTTSFARPDSLFVADQDGYQAGYLSDLRITPTGTVTALYDSSQSEWAGQILLARFAQPAQLSELGDGRLAANGCSGPAALDLPGEPELGLLVAGALER